MYLTFAVSENLHFFGVLFTLGPSQEICFGPFHTGGIPST